jgi:hypothetical protein
MNTYATIFTFLSAVENDTNRATCMMKIQVALLMCSRDLYFTIFVNIFRSGIQCSLIV